jgi:hypothetical protein
MADLRSLADVYLHAARTSDDVRDTLQHANAMTAAELNLLQCYQQDAVFVPDSHATKPKTMKRL